MILDVNSSKKYDEWLDENTNFFSDLENDYDVTVDAGTQDLIELFFGNRYICDDNNFERFYKRTFINSWDRYIDLLRIEKTDIDPLVADYFEDQLVHTGENTGSKSGTTSNTTAYGKTDTLTHNVTVTEDNTITDDEKDTRTLDLAEDNTRTNNLSDSHTRTDNLANSSTRTDNLTNSSTRTDNLADSNIRTDNLANSNTRTDNLSNSNTRTDNLTTTTDNKQAGANAVNPQSIEYSGATAGSLPSLDWQYMSNQEQTEGESTEQQTGTVQNSGTQTGTVSDSGTQTGTVEDAGTHTGTVSTQGSNTGTQTVQGTNTGTVTDDGTHTGTVTDAGTKTGTDTLVKDGDKTEDKEKHTTGTEARAFSGEDETSGSISESTSETEDFTDRKRHTGRTNILPQEALRKAKAYIQKSRAFDWLKDELEPCFISIYDI